MWGKGAEELLGQVLGSRVACTRRNCSTTGGPREAAARIWIWSPSLSLSPLFILSLSRSLAVSAMLALWVGSSLGHVYKLKVCNHISHVAREPEDSDCDFDFDSDLDCVAALSPDVDFGRSFVSQRPLTHPSCLFLSRSARIPRSRSMTARTIFVFVVSLLDCSRVVVVAVVSVVGVSVVGVAGHIQDKMITL